MEMECGEFTAVKHFSLQSTVIWNSLRETKQCGHFHIDTELCSCLLKSWTNFWILWMKTYIVSY